MEFNQDMEATPATLQYTESNTGEWCQIPWPNPIQSWASGVRSALTGLVAYDAQRIATAYDDSAHPSDFYAGYNAALWVARIQRNDERVR